MEHERLSLEFGSRGNTRVAKTSSNCPRGTGYRPRAKERMKISMSVMKGQYLHGVRENESNGSG